NDAGAHWIRRTTLLGSPIFCQSKGENEYIQLVERATHRRKMLYAIRDQFLLADEATRLNGRPETVNETSVWTPPDLRVDAPPIWPATRGRGRLSAIRRICTLNEL